MQDLCLRTNLGCPEKRAGMEISMISVCVFILVAAILPYFCGCMLKCLIKDKSIGLIHTYMVGFVGLWMLFAIVQIPLKIFNAGLNIMAVAYLFVLAVLIAAGCVFADKKRLRHLLEKNIRFERQNAGTYALMAVMIAGIAAQIAVAVIIHENVVYENDYVTARAMQIYTDGRYNGGINPFTGQNTDGMPFGMIMSCSAEFVAVISYIFRTTPLTVANLYIPLVIIPVVYMSYYIMSFILFKNKNHRYMFLTALSLLSVFSNYSLRPKESLWNLMLINSWNPDVMACSILAVLALYYAITTIRAEIKWHDAELEAGSEKADAAYRNVVRNKSIFRSKRVYLTATLCALCFTSVYGIIISTIMCAGVFGCYYVANYGMNGMHIRSYAVSFVPCIVYIAACVIYSAATHNMGSAAGFWNKYAGYISGMFVNDFMTNMYLVITILAIVYIAMKKNNSGKILFVYITAITFLIVVLNPLTYLILGVIAPEYCSVTFWIIPFNAAVAYAAVDIICGISGNRPRITVCCICALMVVMIVAFMPVYGNNFAWQRTRKPDKISDETKQICRIIGDDGQDKNVIALNELCSSLRMSDQGIKLYYYTDNRYAVDDDRDMYVYLNQDEPYLQGIVQNAKRAGYNYVIFRKGVLDPNWSSVQYHIWPVGSTDNYDVYSIGYF